MICILMMEEWGVRLYLAIMVNGLEGCNDKEMERERDGEAFGMAKGTTNPYYF